MIILDTSDLVLQMREHTKGLQELDADENNIFDLVLKALTFENSATLELEYSCLEEVNQYLGLVCQNDMVVIANAITRFGEELFKRLQELKIYQNGYLFYQYGYSVGTDIVLVRIDPQKILR